MGEAGKGSGRRPCCTTREEEHIRWLLYHGRINNVTFKRKYNLLKKKGLIKRDGLVIKG